MLQAKLVASSRAYHTQDLGECQGFAISATPRVNVTSSCESWRYNPAHPNEPAASSRVTSCRDSIVRDHSVACGGCSRCNLRISKTCARTSSHQQQPRTARRWRIFRSPDAPSQRRTATRSIASHGTFARRSKEVSGGTRAGRPRAAVSRDCRSSARIRACPDCCAKSARGSADGNPDSI